MNDVNKKYQKTKNHYNKVYKNYAKNSGIVMDNVINLFLKHVNKNDTILDIGCGPGHDVQYMAEKGYEVSGIDFAENMITYAKKCHGRDFYCLDACNDDIFADVGKINNVWISAMLMFLSKSDQKQLLNKIHKNIPDNGTLGITIPLSINKDRERNDIIFHSYTKDEIHKLLYEAGFRSIDFSKFEFDDNEWGLVIAKNAKIFETDS